MVDIIIRAKNGHDLTEECLASIDANTPDGTYRIILVDDGSDPPYDFATDFSVRHNSPRGAVSATNSGLALSLQFTDSDYVIVMDNDTRVPDGDTTWLERFVAEIEQYPDCGAVGATTNYANPPQHILTVPQTYTGDWEGGTKENVAAPWFVSFCVLMRKDVVRQLGLWDERYNPGNWEDTDYAVQMRVAGLSVRVARSVYIHHKGHSTFSDDLKRLLAENRLKFVEKWGFGRCWDLGIIGPEEVNAVIRQIAAGEGQA